MMEIHYALVARVAALALAMASAGCRQSVKSCHGLYFGEFVGTASGPLRGELDKGGAWSFTGEDDNGNVLFYGTGQVDPVGDTGEGDSRDGLVEGTAGEYSFSGVLETKECVATGSWTVNKDENGTWQMSPSLFP